MGAFPGRERFEEEVVGVLHQFVEPGQHSFSVFRYVNDFVAPVERVGVACDQSLMLQVVDDGDHVAAVEAKPPAQLSLDRRTELDEGSKDDVVMLAKAGGRQLIEDDEVRPPGSAGEQPAR